jgi:hypothetical protein
MSLDRSDGLFQLPLGFIVGSVLSGGPLYEYTCLRAPHFHNHNSPQRSIFRYLDLPVLG